MFFAFSVVITVWVTLKTFSLYVAAVLSLEMDFYLLEIEQ